MNEFSKKYNISNSENLNIESKNILNYKLKPAHLLIVGIIILMAAIFFSGKYHFVHGKDNPLLIIPKISFSLKETYINLDEITGMPNIMAKMKYPLAVRALQKEGILETDEQINERVKKEIEKTQKDLMNLIK